MGNGSAGRAVHAAAPTVMAVQPQRRAQRSAPDLQRKPLIGPVDDPLEREADRVADAVVAGRFTPPIAPAPAPGLQRKCAACSENDGTDEEPCEACAGAIRRQALDDELPEDDELRLRPADHTAGGAAARANAAAAAQAVSTGGAPLSPELRAYFEPRLGTSLAEVRLHTHANAAAAARSIRAHAYTLGRDIAFAPGKFAPGTVAGRRLIAHELAHVMQQAHGTPAVIHRRNGEESEEQGATLEVSEAGGPELRPAEQRELEIRQSRTSPGGVRTELQPFRITLDNFAIDSADLKELHDGAVAELLDILNDAEAGRLRVVIVGHADATGAEAYNRRLSRRRAEAVRRKLRRARGTSVEAIGLGEAQPAMENTTVEGRNRNRRVEIYILPGPAVEVAPEPEPEPEPEPPETEEEPETIIEEPPPGRDEPPPGREEPPLDTDRPPRRRRPPPDDGRAFCARHPIICGGIGVGVGVGIGVGIGILLCLKNPLACVPIPGGPPGLPPGGPGEPGEPQEPERDRPPRRACVASVSLPSGHLVATAHQLGNRWLLTREFEMDLSYTDDPETGCDCSCGEYRQDVRGTAEEDHGSGWSSIPDRELPRMANGQRLHPTRFQEDAHALGPYGHRFFDPLRTLVRPNREGDEFRPDRASGCEYAGTDSPGRPFPGVVSPPPGYRYRFDFRFRSAPVDGCAGRARIGAWRRWRVSGMLEVPRPEPPSTPTPPSTTTPPTTPAPPTPSRPAPPTIGPAPSGPIQRVRPAPWALCLERNIACRTVDFIFEKRGLLVGEERQQAIDIEFNALLDNCALFRPRGLADQIALWRARLRRHAERRIDVYLAWGMQVTEHSAGPPCVR